MRNNSKEKRLSFEEEKAKLHNKVKEKFTLTTLQQERLQSVIYKVTIYDQEYETMLKKVLKEVKNNISTEQDLIDLKELNYRYVMAQEASQSTRNLWEQIDICVEKHLKKSEIQFILNVYLEILQLLAKSVKEKEKTEAIKKLEFIIEELGSFKD